ncbi:MAG: asparagine synthase (glutamine-hydrolyzing) [Desulfobacteraceae bacterium]|nr:asparagine synthase (glutamine-hydrolyzing) [Desulfobacteraceae bacterium]
MCGICGFNWNDQDLLFRMNNMLVHRGPDQDGEFCCEEVSFGHRRLSIIDLSEAGRQPMFNEDGSVCLVFNGEIYNFPTLRSELIEKGHVFTSNTDSEVIIHGYEEFGVDVLDKLQGMFAFAIYDRNRKRIFIARDRVGIKPLYYYFKEGKFVFASEIKAILEDRSIPREVNNQALYDYIGFEFVPAPSTMFKNIFKLNAGHYLVLQNGELQNKKYWDLSFQQHSQKMSYNENVEHLRHLLDASVKSHLISDVPLGVFLSGGLDSSTLVAMMRRHISGSLKTFTIGYHDKSFSELDYAEIVAKHFETDHQVLMLDDINADYVEKTLYHLDEPMTDLSTVPLYLLCKQAREHVTVCLSGEGADESFAGYDRFKASKLNLYFSLLPEIVRKKVIGKIISKLPDQPQKKGAINMLKRFVEGANLPQDGKHLRWQYFSSSNQNHKLFSDSFKQDTTFDPFRSVRQYTDSCDATDRINEEVYLDMRFMMTDSVLMKVDKMSMASSLEIRVPLLDHVLVEFLATMPGDWKLKGLETKHVFRSALQGILPDKIVNRGKQGYSLPVKHLLRGELKQYMVSLLNDSPLIKRNMNIEYVNQLIQEHSDMVHNHNHVLWALMNLSIWHNKFFQ